MPAVITPCGGGGGSSAAIYIGRYGATVNPVASGVTLTADFDAFATNDPTDASMDITSGAHPQAKIMSADYVYTVTVMAHWDAFAGNRTLTLGTADGETGWFFPFTLTNTDASQMLTALLRPDFTAPTTLTITLAQASGVTRDCLVTGLVQALQLSV